MPCRLLHPDPKSLFHKGGGAKGFSHEEPNEWLTEEKTQA